MRVFAKLLFGVVLTVGGGIAAVPAAYAETDVGISFGWSGPGYVPFGDPCAYYDYYDVPPPWGLPPDYCDYPVYFGTVYWDNIWYRGPIYYRWFGGERLFWINGGWRRDSWHGGRPPTIQWRERGSGGSVHFRLWDRGGRTPDAGRGREVRPRYARPTEDVRQHEEPFWRNQYDTLRPDRDAKPRAPAPGWRGHDGPGVASQPPVSGRDNRSGGDRGGFGGGPPRSGPPGFGSGPSRDSHGSQRGVRP